MRVLIISDTHGRHTGMDRALEEAGDIDLFIHLGDVEGGEEYINAVVDCEKHMVRELLFMKKYTLSITYVILLTLCLPLTCLYIWLLTVLPIPWDALEAWADSFGRGGS